MEIIRSHHELTQHLRELHNPQEGNLKTIGFVPTMGYLHEGHLSLVHSARKDNDIVVVSIFVNPTQFAPNEDLEAYPRDEQRDLELLRAEQTDVVYIPPVDDIYPEGFSTYVQPPSQALEFEGETRPTHFRGVCTVVSILFNLVQPDRAYFGRKDAQQAAVIKQMTSDFKFPIQICVEDIVREPDGLAMSSRNIYLSNDERQAALVLQKSLNQAINLYKQGNTNCLQIIDRTKETIKQQTLVKLDYIAIVNQDTFQPVERITKGDIIIGAIFVGKTRLIDNLIFK